MSEDKVVGTAVHIEHYVAANLALLPLHWIMSDGWCSCRRTDCPSPGKHPLTAHGKDDASAAVSTVRGWLDRWPSANWGIRPPVGVVVLDVDPRNGGDASMRELTARHGRLPVTLTARTGSGGWHVWLAYSGPLRGRLAPGVDVKAHTGYVVVPPSRHVSGGSYAWATLALTAPAPGWVRQSLRPPRVVANPMPMRSAGPSSALVRVVAGAGEGNRNALLHWAACRAHERGDDKVLDDLIVAAESVGLSVGEAVRTVESAARTVGMSQ